MFTHLKVHDHAFDSVVYLHYLASIDVLFNVVAFRSSHSLCVRTTRARKYVCTWVAWVDHSNKEI